VQLESAQAGLNNLPTPQIEQGDEPTEPQTPVHREERPRSREGLPAAFRMRHGRHYVEQLMGDAPLRTVREIAVSDIEIPSGDPGNIEELSQSIKEVGILQPILVSQLSTPARNDARFRIIAGASRYRAAVHLGLLTVPCLVCEPGTHTVDVLREAAARRAAPPVSPEPPMSTLSEDSRRAHPAAGLREVTSRLAFVSAVMPALDVAGYDPLRWNVLTDLMKVEMERARSTAAAIEWLASSMVVPEREPVEAAAVLDAVLEAVGPEARLQSVKLEVTSTLDRYRLSADRAMLVRALTGLIQGMLALSPASSTLRIACSGTAVRPALIVAVTQHDCEVPPASLDRFFDPDFVQHPNGLPGAMVLAGVAQVARLHGGRVHARADERGGCTATFVIPKPLVD
jgi:hypothetical protein